MPIFNPLQLAEDACGFWNNNNLPNLIDGFAFDSRQIEKGNLFLALKGTLNDGHDYLYAAMQKGASGAIVEKVNDSISLPQLKVPNVAQALERIASLQRERFLGSVIGITGSCGKTTTKDLLTHLLHQEVHSTFLNYNNLLGVPITLLNLDSASHKYGIIEAGINITGEMNLLASMIKPDISIITNIFPVHLDGLNNVGTIAKEKALLAQATKENGFVLFPSACLTYHPFQCLGLKTRVIAKYNETINNFPNDQIIRYEIKVDLDNSLLIGVKLSEMSEEKIFNLPLLSEGMVTNVVLAICTALLMGVNEEQIRNRLLIWTPSKFRGQVYEYGKQIYYADCYNANPISMLDALTIFQKRFHFSSKHLYILGCMAELGEKVDFYHYQVGKSLKLRGEDRIILLGEHAESYKLGLVDAGNSFSQILYLQNKEKVLDYLKEFEGTIFLKGSNFYELWKLLPEQAKLEEKRKVEFVVC